MSDRTNIKIPKELYESLRGQIEGTGFKSVTDFIINIMREIVSDGKDTEYPHHLNQSEINQMRKRLKILGYIKCNN